MNREKENGHKEKAGHRCFVLDPEKKEQFLKDAAASSSFSHAMCRAVRNMRGFQEKRVKRKPNNK